MRGYTGEVNPSTLLLAASLLLSPVVSSAQSAYPDPAADWVHGEGVSVKRPGHKIIVWALPEAQKSFGEAGLKAIVAAGDRNLASLGVSTRLVIYKGKRLSREMADAMGKLAILGSKKNVLLLAPANGLITQDEATWLQSYWNPDGTNPEKSENGHSSGDGRYSMIGSEACFSFAQTAGIPPVEAAALFIIHGVGHQAGIGMGPDGHTQEQNFMDDGARLVSMLSGKMVVGEGGAAPSFDKRPIVDLFKADKFATASAYAGKLEPLQRNQWAIGFSHKP